MYTNVTSSCHWLCHCHCCWHPWVQPCNDNRLGKTTTNTWDADRFGVDAEVSPLSRTANAASHHGLYIHQWLASLSKLTAVTMVWDGSGYPCGQLALIGQSSKLQPNANNKWPISGNSRAFHRGWITSNHQCEPPLENCFNINQPLVTHLLWTPRRSPPKRSSTADDTNPCVLEQLNYNWLPRQRFLKVDSWLIKNYYFHLFP